MGRRATTLPVHEQNGQPPADQKPKFRLGAESGRRPGQGGRVADSEVSGFSMVLRPAAGAALFGGVYHRLGPAASAGPGAGRDLSGTAGLQPAGRHGGGQCAAAPAPRTDIEDELPDRVSDGLLLVGAGYGAAWARRAGASRSAGCARAWLCWPSPPSASWDEAWASPLIFQPQQAAADGDPDPGLPGRRVRALVGLARSDIGGEPGADRGADGPDRRAARAPSGGPPERRVRALSISSLLFNIAFGLISVFYTLWAALAALRPGRGAVRRVIAGYVRRMIWAMAVFASRCTASEVRGRDRLPPGPFILGLPSTRLLRRRLFHLRPVR